MLKLKMSKPFIIENLLAITVDLYGYFIGEKIKEHVSVLVLYLNCQEFSVPLLNVYEIYIVCLCMERATLLTLL